jgi:alpha-1,2-mannosyltransferase
VQFGAVGGASRLEFRAKPGDGPRSRTSRARGLLLLRVAAIAAAIAGAIDFVIAPLQGHFSGQFEDYGDYLAAARAVGQHTDVYASFVNHVQPIPVQGFDYPPIVAWMLQPLGWLPGQTAVTVWLLTLVGCTVAGTAIIAFELLPASWPRLEVAALAAFVYAPVTYSLWHGQASAIVFLFLALALRSWMRERQWSLGVFIAIAACIKVAPVILVVLLVRRRMWKACAALAATLAAGVVGGVLTLGFQTTREYVTHVLPVLTWQNGWIYNQSAAGAVNRLLGHSVLAFGQSSVVVSAFTIVVAVGAVAIAALLARPSERSREVRGAQFALGILAMLLAGSVTWFWHLSALLIVLAAVVGLIASGRVRRPCRLIITAGAVVLTTGVIAPIFIASTSMASLTALSHSWLWWPAIQLVSTPVVAIAALFVVLWLEMRHATTDAVSTSGRWTVAALAGRASRRQPAASADR